MFLKRSMCSARIGAIFEMSAEWKLWSASNFVGYAVNIIFSIFEERNQMTDPQI